ncbi:hypothetical protein D3C81_1983240 [compost metagenome]
MYTPTGYLPLSRSAHSSIWAMVWLANELLITYDGWPVAQPRFTRRPLASRMIFLPSGNTTWSTCGLISSHWYFSTEAMSISLSK